LKSFNTDEESFQLIEKKLSKELDRKRFVHTMGVANTAVNLAMAHQADLEQAYLAGLLHDNAKCLSAEDKKKLAKKYHFVLNAAEEKNPDLLHAKLGAKLAEKVYGIKDETILNAIQYHTTGRPDMTEMEKIIYIADYIEPNRKMLPELTKVRQTAFRDLDQTMILILENTLNYLKQKEAVIDSMTQETYKYYQNLLKTVEKEK
jgi:predicted HD superfamily hydrolase involved in NAD metabolism